MVLGSQLTVRPLDIPDVLLVRPERFPDERGYFVETYNLRQYAAAGIGCQFVQDNQSLSTRCGTVRGLHFQVPPQAQAKLVHVIRGQIFDVAVDLRKGSPSFGRWCGATLTAQGGEQLFIPRGFAHGFCTLEPDTEVAYRVDNFYASELERGLYWNDPTLGIAWPVGERDAVLSNRDRQLRPFSNFDSPFRI
jgi:dTDP-4-dehydrorhamnose 3,5-epimerase